MNQRLISKLPLGLQSLVPPRNHVKAPTLLKLHPCEPLQAPIKKNQHKNNDLQKQPGPWARHHKLASSPPPPPIFVPSVH